MKQPPPRQGSSTFRQDDLSHLPPLPPSPFLPTFGADKKDDDVAPTEGGDALRVPKQTGLRRAASAISPRRMSLFRSSTLQANASSSNLNGEPKSPSEASSGNGSYFSYFGSSRMNATPSSMSSKNDSTTSDVAGPRFPLSQVSTPQPDGERAAGDPAVYSSAEWAEGDNMVRERVSTRGVLRPLEAEADLSAFTIAPENIGVVSELAARRFLKGTQRWDRKFASAAKTVEKHRQRNLERAKKDTVRNMNVLHNFIGREAEAKGKGQATPDADKTVNGIKDGLLASSGSWSWAWALDAHENPPPSSIVSRRDTQEALRLARIADQPMLQSEEHSMTGNNLWSVITNFLTVTPDKDKYKKSDDNDGAGEQEKAVLRPRKSTLSRIFPPKEKEKETT